jgi:hypothetical protein
MARDVRRRTLRECREKRVQLNFETPLKSSVSLASQHLRDEPIEQVSGVVRAGR